MNSSKHPKGLLLINTGDGKGKTTTRSSSLTAMISG